VILSELKDDVKVFLCYLTSSASILPKLSCAMNDEPIRQNEK